MVDSPTPIIIIGRFLKKLRAKHAILKRAPWGGASRRISMYQRKDHFYKKAKEEGYASRAVYKLIEVQKKYRILKKGDQVLELGSAPGGWFKILAKEIGPKGHVVGIDRLPLKIPLPSNALFIQQDIEEPLKLEQTFDVILSDLSPDLSGIIFRDTYQSHELAKKVLSIAQKHLKQGGHLVIKIFPGKETVSLKQQLKQFFEELKTFRPEATRKTSSEIYFIALKKKAAI